MIFWLIIAIALGFLGVLELFLNFTIPFIALRMILLFLLILGMSYRIYLMERGGEKERLKKRIMELEDKVRELEMGASQE